MRECCVALIVVKYNTQADTESPGTAIGEDLNIHGQNSPPLYTEFRIIKHRIEYLFPIYKINLDLSSGIPDYYFHPHRCYTPLARHLES